MVYENGKNLLSGLIYSVDGSSSFINHVFFFNCFSSIGNVADKPSERKIIKISFKHEIDGKKKKKTIRRILCFSGKEGKLQFHVCVFVLVISLYIL